MQKKSSRYKVEPFRRCSKCGNKHMDSVNGFWICSQCGNVVRIKAIINGRMV